MTLSEVFSTRRGIAWSGSVRRKLDDMTISRRPHGLETKTAVLASPMGEVGAANGGTTRVDTAAATVELIASVTGVVDDVGDLIEPGAYEASLRRRTPKVILGHDWQRPIGRVLRVRELRPGDPALPKRTASGAPWPRAAGALVVLAELNQNTLDGKDALSNIEFFGDQSQFSVGYKSVRATHRGGVRHLHEIDLFEVSPVLFGANKLTGVLGKSGRPAALEVKRTPVGASVPTTGRRWALSCSMCAQPTALADAPLKPNARLICRTCVDSVGAMVDPFADPDLDNAQAPDPTSEAVYQQALRDERRMHADPHGVVRPGPRDRRRL